MSKEQSEIKRRRTFIKYLWDVYLHCGTDLLITPAFFLGAEDVVMAFSRSETEDRRQ